MALARELGGKFLSVWKSSCLFDDSLTQSGDTRLGRALVVCTSHDRQMTIAWTVCAHPPATLLSKVSSIVQGQCTHHIPGISFQLESNVLPETFSAWAISSEAHQPEDGSFGGVFTGPHLPSAPVGSEGASAEVDPGVGPGGCLQKYSMFGNSEMGVLPPKVRHLLGADLCVSCSNSSQST